MPGLLQVNLLGTMESSEAATTVEVSTASASRSKVPFQRQVYEPQHGQLPSYWLVGGCVCIYIYVYTHVFMD